MGSKIEQTGRARFECSSAGVRLAGGVQMGLLQVCQLSTQLWRPTGYPDATAVSTMALIHVQSRSVHVNASNPSEQI